MKSLRFLSRYNTSLNTAQTYLHDKQPKMGQNLRRNIFKYLKLSTRSRGSGGPRTAKSSQNRATWVRIMVHILHYLKGAACTSNKGLDCIVSSLRNGSFQMIP